MTINTTTDIRPGDRAVWLNNRAGHGVTVMGVHRTLRGWKATIKIDGRKRPRRVLCSTLTRVDS